MLHFVVLLNFIFGVGRFVNGSNGEDDFGAALISSMRNDANLDLSVDEEYEDLRAELLAYHTALASLSGSGTQSRRSMMTTPCWQLGGICINVRLCKGYRFLTEIPGCKNRLNVCCFAWNKFRAKDYKPQDIAAFRLPWSIQHKFGGKGVVEVNDEPDIQMPISNVNEQEKGRNQWRAPKESPNEWGGQKALMDPWAGPEMGGAKIQVLQAHPFNMSSAEAGPIVLIRRNFKK